MKPITPMTVDKTLAQEPADPATHAAQKTAATVDAEVALWLPALGCYIEPALAAIRQQLPSGLPAIDYVALEPQLRTQLGGLLLLHAKRTLVLELNVARLLGTLRGDTPEQRFSDFLGRYSSRKEAWTALEQEYPVLAERLQLEQQRFIANITEVLACLTRDWAAIVEEFPGARGCTHLVALAGGMSDGHRGGHSVMRLGFAKRLAGTTSAPESAESLAGDAPAESFVLMFKPKDLSVDRHFQALLQRCNAAAQRGELSLRKLQHGRPAESLGEEFPALYEQRILPRRGYGWVEYLAAADCADQAAVARFYVRQGGFLALLHVLQGTDLHYENIIACGEHPVLVDLETLFHHPFRPRSYDHDAGARTEQLLDDSVLRTGLLPGRAWGGAAQPGINIGGLGNEDGQAVPQATTGFVASGTDEMKLAVKQTFMPKARNLPRVRDQIAPAAQYVEEIVAGFEAMLRFICSQRSSWLSTAADSPLMMFAADEVRHIVRATTVYAKLLAAATHPDFLRSAKAHEELLLLLAESDAQVPAAVVQAELADLRCGDVPFFTTRPGSRDLWDGQGGCHGDYFPADCLTTVRSRLAALTGEQLERQIFLVRAALSASAFGTRVSAAAASIAKPTPLPAAAVNSAGQRAREHALNLGERLLRGAIHGPQDATWIGMKFSGETACEVAPVDAHLYDGQAGIALYLAYLGTALYEPKFSELAAAAAQRVHRSVLAAKDGSECGGFIGLPSQLYALSHAAAVLDEPRLVRGLAPALAKLQAAAQGEAPVASDVIYGAAGAVLALLSLHSVSGDDAALAAAAQFGRRLLKDAVPCAGGLAWPSHAAATPLLGFAHGTAGVYCALTRLAAAVTAQGGFGSLAHDCLRAAAAALVHERAHFDKTEQNWPDLRCGTESARFMRTWCHGAPGVLLSRVAAHAKAPGAAATPLAMPPAVVDEIEAAVRTTLSTEAAEHSLCHGEVGNLLIVAQAAAVLQRRTWQEQLQARLHRLLLSLNAAPPRCGFAFPDAAPSLMTGMSGVGYGLLSLAGAPGEFPNVLALAPPLAKKRLT